MEGASSVSHKVGSALSVEQKLWEAWVGGGFGQA